MASNKIRRLAERVRALEEMHGIVTDEQLIESMVTLDQAQAEASFRGAGITVNITGINTSDTAQIAEALRWITSTSAV